MALSTLASVGESIILEGFGRPQTPPSPIFIGTTEATETRAENAFLVRRSARHRTPTPTTSERETDGTEERARQAPRRAPVSADIMRGREFVDSRFMGNCFISKQLCA